MRVLVTGADGFIGKNLIVRLGELKGFEAVKFSHGMSQSDLISLVTNVDAVVHLAGVNRPVSPEEFLTGNFGFTQTLCEALLRRPHPVSVLFSSSTQATLQNDYGRSKHDAEKALRHYAERSSAKVYVYRLPNVFGKWCRPNYNSVVATFCYNIARGLPITINDANASLTLSYVDDVVDDFVRVIHKQPQIAVEEVLRAPVEYKTTVGALARQIEAFRDSRSSLISERVGEGLTRALYSTYVSYLPLEAFSYEIPKYDDSRGVFVEMLKTKDSGQFSFFTAHPGITRGGHYHHTKTEKFLVIKGHARFGFRHILTNESSELFTSGARPQIVETIPGWSHDITNVGKDEMVVMLWASEIYDRTRPDTVPCKV